MGNIYQFNCITDFLKITLQEKQKRNPSYSMRSWAQTLGMKSHGPLQQALAGKRSLPMKYVPTLSKDLSLNNEESLYLETLIQIKNSKTDIEKSHYMKLLKERRPKGVKTSSQYLNNLTFFNNPLHGILRSLIDRDDFIYDLGWIQNKLNFKTTQQEIKTCIENLIDMNLVEVIEDTLVNKVSMVRNKEDIPSHAVREYHKIMSQKAINLIDTQNLQSREFNSFTININPEKLPEIKKKIREFVQETMDEFESHVNSHTYQLNLQLFELANR